MKTARTPKLSWKKVQILGSGGFGVVHLAIVTCVDTGFRGFVAVKSAEAEHALPLRKEKERMVESNFRDCPHLLCCLGDDITRENGTTVYNVFLDYCPGGSIADLIRKTGFDATGRLCLPEETARRYAESVLLGLKFLHESNIMHRDIKPDNLLLDAEGEVKIADFGLAKKLTEGSESMRCKSKKGTLNYMAPETVKQGIYGKGVDIWALGCSVVEMITGEMLFKGDEKEIVLKLCNLHGLPNIDPSAVMTNTAVDFLKKCMYVEPTERWTAQMLLQHPFITGREDPEEEEDPKGSSSCLTEDDIMAINARLSEMVDFQLEEDHPYSSLEMMSWPSRRDQELAETLHGRLQII